MACPGRRAAAETIHPSGNNDRVFMGIPSPLCGREIFLEAQSKALLHNESNPLIARSF
jgi:hypothetical protein